MTATTKYPHISSDDPVKAHIGDTRYKVVHLAAEHFHYGWSAEELLRQHPDLRPEEVYASLAYFYDHFDEIVQAIKATADQAELQRSAQTLTRDELLRRGVM